MNSSRVISFAIGCCVLLGCASANRRTQRECDSVTVKFLQLETEERLTGLDVPGLGDLVVEPVSVAEREQPPFVSFAGPLRNCKRLYVVDVGHVGKKSKYFFCCDSGQPNLLCAFRMEGEKWIDQLLSGQMALNALTITHVKVEQLQGEQTPSIYLVACNTSKATVAGGSYRIIVTIDGSLVVNESDTFDVVPISVPALGKPLPTYGFPLKIEPGRHEYGVTVEQPGVGTNSVTGSFEWPPKRSENKDGKRVNTQH